MAFNIELYEFKKKTNSTATPVTGGGKIYSCTPRHSISVLSPVVSIKYDGMLSVNYAYIPRYNRYYWVTNIVNTASGLWQLSLTVDVLASFKDDVLNASEYVARSAVAYNGNIVDNMYPSKSGSYIKMTSAGVPWVDDLYQGTFVVGVINGISAASSTAVTYYAFTAAQYAQLLSSLQNQTTMASILGITVNDSGIVEGLTGCLQDISYDVYIAQLNPIQYVVSSVYIPLASSSLPLAGVTSVKLGKWDMGFTASFLNVTCELNLGSISIPKHPQYSSRGQYLNAPPYSVYSTHFPGFGTIELDGTRLSRWSTLSAKCVFDAYNGSGYLYLNTNDPDEKDGCVGILSGSIGIPVPVTQMLATDLKGQLIANVASAVGTLAGNVSTLTSGDLSEGATNFWNWLNYNPNNFDDVMSQGEKSAALGQSINKVTSGVVSGIQSIPTLTLSGSVGGSAALWGEWWIKNEYFILVDEDLETLGRPLMEVRRLGDLSGFCQCLNTHIQTSGTATETQAVNSMAMNGFFIE